ncbi:unnamed protein product [Angiostrongylus costaricensis]|uniref:C2H2-type domain-containing protein n=1 Tax=Angiostrongylus costaricensis TaxID=334426 RepID=A0A0R3PEY1_ANGCS|nr:unnamed protein product [Angiostrongylus costaricensis]
MIGENILHFRIVKAPVEETCLYATEYVRCMQMFFMWENVTRQDRMGDVHCSSKRYRCDTCNAQFCSKDRLVSHMRYHPGMWPSCTICTKSFCRSTSLALHMKMHITGHRHFCQICGRWFKSLSSLTEHEVG